MIKTIIFTVIVTLSVIGSFLFGQKRKEVEFSKERRLNEERLKEAEATARQAVAKANMLEKTSQIVTKKVESKKKDYEASTHQELVSLIGEMVKESRDKLR